MKGKDVFTKNEIDRLKSLIAERNAPSTSRSGQKRIRDEMRKIGFYGGDDFGIYNLQLVDFENLIMSGRIKISDMNDVKGEHRNESVEKQENLDFQRTLEEFELLDPVCGKEISPQCDYIVCLEDGSPLPDIGEKVEMKTHMGLRVIYVGTTKRLWGRYREHFMMNNSGKSTLRKSLGAMFGYQQVPRDKENPNNGKTKFVDEDEERLSEWMINNLKVFYKSYMSYNSSEEIIEEELIKFYNPPLNLDRNNNSRNKSFREKLSAMRKNKGAKR